MERTRKKKTLNGTFIVISIVVLILIIAGCLFYFHGKAPLPSDALTITEGEKILKVYEVSDLEKMGSVSVEKTIQSGSQKPESGTFTGVPMEVILNDVDVKLLDEHENFVLRASDGYETAISKKDIIAGKNVLVVFAKDGKDLQPISEHGTGPLRIIILSDQFGNRSIKGLSEIQVK